MNHHALQSQARALDAADTLAPLRAQFALPHGASGEPHIYFCGHSLGLAPRAARQLVDEELADWEALGVTGHHAGRRHGACSAAGVEDHDRCSGAE